MADDDKTKFEGWCVLELMGHRRLAGYVTEEEIAGHGMLRLDVPGENGQAATQFYSPASLYCLTPTTEEIARAIAKRNQPAPVQRWELPAPTTSTSPTPTYRDPDYAADDDPDLDDDEDR